jgi:hypothetical protein
VKGISFNLFQISTLKRSGNAAAGALRAEIRQKPAPNGGRAKRMAKAKNPL